MPRKQAVSEGFSERLRAKLPRGAQVRVAEALAVDITTVNRWSKGMVPEAETLIRLALHLGTTAEFLLTGRDPPATVRLEDLPQPRIIWSDALAADAVDQTAAIQRMKQKMGQEEDYRAIPLVEGSVAAGGARVVSEQIEGLAIVYQPSLGRRTDLVAVRISGDSMSPILTNGSMVIVDRGDRRIRTGMAFLVRLDGGAVVKYVDLDGQDLVLISENRAYRDVRVRLEEGQESPVCGVVVWSWRAWTAADDDAGQAGEKKSRYRTGKRS